MVALTLNEHSLRLEPVSDPNPRASAVTDLCALARSRSASVIESSYGGPHDYRARVWFEDAGAAMSWRAEALIRCAELGIVSSTELADRCATVTLPDVDVDSDEALDLYARAHGLCLTCVEAPATSEDGERCAACDAKHQAWVAGCEASEADADARSGR